MMHNFHLGLDQKNEYILLEIAYNEPIKISLPLVETNGCSILKQKRALAELTAMSHVRIWVHLVFATKNRKPFLRKEIRYGIQKHIIENCITQEIFLKAINGHTDHLHCLISLGKDQTIAKISQLIKGESSFWINKNNLTQEKFTWQDDYFAVSVSESQVETVINYIKNQENHHTKKSFDEEVNEFLEKYEWELIKN